MAGLHHGNNRAKRNKRRRGAHRALARNPELATWLGASAVTVGIGAALLAGAGSAAAETEDSSASSATTSTADRAETEKPSVKTTTSPKPDTDREAVSVRTPDPRNSLDKPGNETEDNADEAGGDASSGAVSRRGSSAASTPNAPRSRKAASEDTIDSEVSLNDDGHEEATIPPATDFITWLTEFITFEGFA